MSENKKTEYEWGYFIDDNKMPSAEESRRFAETKPRPPEKQARIDAIMKEIAEKYLK